MAPAPSGPGLTLLVLSLVLLSLSWMTMLLRAWARWRIKGIGLDDWLMVAGLIFFTIACDATSLAALNGVGTRDQYLDTQDYQHSKMWFMLFQLFYVLSTVPIKSSICVALLRITTRPLYRWILYAVMFLATVSCLVTDITVLTYCKPISATWNPSDGTCADKSIIINVSYFISISSILTDWVCAILPAFILWNVQLRYRVKISVGVVLALGFVASTATIVRIGYLPYYSIAEDYLYNVSQIAIWSIIESGIGIIAGSMATLRPLLQYIPFLSSTFNSSSSKSKKTKQRGQSYKLDSLRASHAGVLQTKCHAGRDEFGFDSASASQKAILHRSTEKAILQSTEIRITKDIVQASTEDGEDTENTDIYHNNV